MITRNKQCYSDGVCEENLSQQTVAVERSKLLSRAMALCAKSEHCEGEIQEKLRAWGATEADQASIMATLVEERYIDDERFSRAYIHDKLEYNHWGRKKIEQMLWAKGVDKAVFSPLLDAVDEEQWLSHLRPLIQQKRRSVKAANDYELTQKLLRFALGRGFTYDEAMKVI